ncbi:NepR family anti-sigma factor, partial [Phenylobacterium sp.]
RNQFESLVAEPLPDHLLDLLNELERREGES